MVPLGHTFGHSVQGEAKRMNEKISRLDPGYGRARDDYGRHLAELKSLLDVLAGNPGVVTGQPGMLLTLNKARHCLDILTHKIQGSDSLLGLRDHMQSENLPGQVAVGVEHLVRIADLVRSGRLEMSNEGERRKIETGLPHWSVPSDGRLVQAELDLLGLMLPKARAGCLDIMVWGVIDWHFRIQRPQHLARLLAERGNRVFYVSNDFIDRPHPGFTIETLDEQQRLFQVQLYLSGRPQIYAGPPAPPQIAQLDGGLEAFGAWSGSRDFVSIIHHPYWFKLAEHMRSTCIVYDCLDHQTGFSDNSSGILAEESRLLEQADLVVVTSGWLQQELAHANRDITIIRNACEYERFANRPEQVFVDEQGRKVIGYYGAIEGWLDILLLRAVAERFPEHLLLLIGRDMLGAGSALSDLSNVRLVGEVEYEQLPYWLHGFDVCLLPFRVLPLTMGTNPVKIYEYLSAGKPVVAVDLPEMSQFGDLIQTAANHEAFLGCVASALISGGDVSQVSERQAFAARQTWEHRVDQLEEALPRGVLPRVSVIVAAVGGNQFTRNFLDSLDLFSGWPDMETIVVANRLEEGMADLLETWRSAGELRQVINIDATADFATACNLGLAAATGEFLVVLDHHTFVTRGWVRGLLAHLRSDPGIGLVSPTTNHIGNEARIDIDYADMEQMAARSRLHTVSRTGLSFDLSSVAFYCVAMARSTYERVGPLRQGLEGGSSLDDDYLGRVKELGLRCVCAEDVFVHHHRLH